MIPQNKQSYMDGIMKNLFIHRIVFASKVVMASFLMCIVLLGHAHCRILDFDKSNVFEAVSIILANAAPNYSVSSLSFDLNYNNVDLTGYLLPDIFDGCIRYHSEGRAIFSLLPEQLSVEEMLEYVSAIYGVKIEVKGNKVELRLPLHIADVTNLIEGDNWEIWKAGALKSAIILKSKKNSSAIMIGSGLEALSVKNNDMLGRDYLP